MLFIVLGFWAATCPLFYLLRRALITSTLYYLIIGPSGVRVLPVGVAANRSVHYFSFLSFLLPVPHTFLLGTGSKDPVRLSWNLFKVVLFCNKWKI